MNAPFYVNQVSTIHNKTTQSFTAHMLYTLLHNILRICCVITMYIHASHAYTPFTRTKHSFDFPAKFYPQKRINHIQSTTHKYIILLISLFSKTTQVNFQIIIQKSYTNKKQRK